MSIPDLAVTELLAAWGSRNVGVQEIAARAQISAQHVDEPVVPDWDDYVERVMGGLPAQPRRRRGGGPRVAARDGRARAYVAAMDGVRQLASDELELGMTDFEPLVADVTSWVALTSGGS